MVPVRCSSFPPVVGDSPRILILGSMPGVISLERQQYYAHPRNAFWSIIGEIYGISPDLEYGERLRHLADAGIVLWDVLKHCEREGSLDSAICRESEIVNDIPGMLNNYPGIRKICFNGAKAWETFQRNMSQAIDLEVIQLVKLPSTSPANATYSYERKLESWKKALTGEKC